ncbi:MAG: CDP-alcohol phosphatidyltransferase family protein [Clostridia bacterium]|nr:CDP-alcohol phosphatidyltransferase family protein [Clostridia bacterium]
MKKNIPNILTISRFIFIPLIIIALIIDKYLLAFILLTVSSLTDVLDGFLARKYNLITDFGKLIDPLADKATQLSILITLSVKQTSSGEAILPLWILFIIVLKEILMVAGASFLYGKDLVVSSKWYGKLTTVLFYLAIVCSLIIAYFNISFRFDTYLYYLGLAMTIFSLIMYFRSFYAQGYLKNLQKYKKD